MELMLLRNGVLMLNDPQMREELVATRFSISFIDARSLQEFVNFGMKAAYQLGKTGEL